MSCWKIAFLLLVVIAIATIVYGVLLIHQGFSARAQRSAAETAVARIVRDLAILRIAKYEKNAFTSTPEILAEARATNDRNSNPD